MTHPGKKSSGIPGRALPTIIHPYKESALPDHVRPDATQPVRLRERPLNAWEILQSHSHPWAQLTYAHSGVLRVSVANQTWIVPPLRAIWIPPDVQHEIVTTEKSLLHALYIFREALPFDGNACLVLTVSPLLRELIAALANPIESDSAVLARRHYLIGQLILTELPATQQTSASLGVPSIRITMPSEKRLKALCRLVINAPESDLTLAEWAQQVGASERTLARLFREELHMTFGQWRQQIRIAHAAPMLARGMPLSVIANELGYASASAFTAMFKKIFGQPPSVFFAQRDARNNDFS